MLKSAFGQYAHDLHSSHDKDMQLQASVYSQWGIYVLDTRRLLMEVGFQLVGLPGIKFVASRHRSQKIDYTGLSNPTSAWDGLKVGRPRAPSSQASVTSTTRPYKTSNLLISTGKSTGICVKISFRPICSRLTLVP